MGKQLPTLCESCGYVIDGLPEMGACPECGTSIASSLPAARVGLPWQNGKEWWWRTGWRVLRRPRASFRLIGIHARGGLQFMAWCCLAAAVLVAISVGWMTYCDRWQADEARLTVIVGVLAGAVVFPLLTAVERIGIGFFGRRRGWRVDREAAWTVCGFASIGWVVGGVLSLGVTLVHIMAVLWLRPSNEKSFGLMTLAFGAHLAAWIIGMLTFEILVYVGVRQCRYANRGAKG